MVHNQPANFRSSDANSIAVVPVAMNPAAVITLSGTSTENDSI
jgi:hypothetical protein